MTIKIGDWVRCTLRESTLLGKAGRDLGTSCDVMPDGADTWNILSTPPWQVEVISPEIPDEIGTLVMAVHGSVYRREDRGWVQVTSDPYRLQGSRTLEELRRDLGPLTHIATVKP